MKILAPLREFEQINIYSEAGATEFYFGFEDPEWDARYGSVSDLNRMSAMKNNANHFMKIDVQQIINRIHEKNCCCYLVLNGNAYSSDQVEYLSEFFIKLKEKPDGIIFSDIQLISHILDAGIKPVASTMCAIYNTDILAFYKKAGVTRIIFPRELSLQEMSDFLKINPEIQFEAFLMRDGCMFSDSNCLGVHRGNFGGICSYIRSTDYQLFSNENQMAIKKMKYRHFLYSDAMLRNACGLCAIYRMIEMNIHSVKIVGRADRTEEVQKDILAVKRNIEIASKCITENQYLNNMYLPDRWKMVCGMSCYYPEIS